MQIKFIIVLFTLSYVIFYDLVLLSLNTVNRNCIYICTIRHADICTLEVGYYFKIALNIFYPVCY